MLNKDLKLVAAINKGTLLHIIQGIDLAGFFLPFKFLLIHSW